MKTSFHAGYFCHRRSVSSRKSLFRTLLLITWLAIGAGRSAPATGSFAGTDNPIAAPTPQSTAPSAPAPQARTAPQSGESQDAAALPEGMRIPRYAPGAIPFGDGAQLVYRASWIGIPAADARIELHRDRKNRAMWSGEAWLSTNKAVDILYQMRDHLREDFSRSSLAPAGFHITQHENRRRNEYLASFDHKTGVVTMTKRNRRGAQTSRFLSHNPWGPISGAMMALSQPLALGDELTFDVFGGRNRYVIRFKVARRERISTPLGDFDALRIVPSMLYLSDSDARHEARETTVWVSADDRHLPLRIEAAAFIGTLRIDLIKASP
ncbi:MAG: DUF3108 domain-containing protein [Candidatus Binataceae bacterium]